MSKSKSAAVLSLGRTWRPDRHAARSHQRPVDAAADARLLAAGRARVGSGSGRALFDAMAREYEGWAASDVELLVRAAQLVDRLDEARAIIERDGLVVAGAKGGQVRHPCLIVESRGLAELRAILRQLGRHDAAP